jgi:hypothetical protein
MCASIIIGTSLAPSPTAKVIHLPFFFARATTSDFYFGDTLQQRTEFAVIPKSKNTLASFSFSKMNVSVNPSITMLFFGFLGVAFQALANLLRSSPSLVELSTISSITSSFIKLQLLPISMAVSYLSPVKTQILIPADISFSIVSGTSS